MASWSLPGMGGSEAGPVRSFFPYRGQEYHFSSQKPLHEPCRAIAWARCDYGAIAAGALPEGCGRRRVRSNRSTRQISSPARRSRQVSMTQYMPLAELPSPAPPVLATSSGSSTFALPVLLGCGFRVLRLQLEKRLQDAEEALTSIIGERQRSTSPVGARRQQVGARVDARSQAGRGRSRAPADLPACRSSCGGIRGAPASPDPRSEDWLQSCRCSALPTHKIAIRLLANLLFVLSYARSCFLLELAPARVTVLVAVVGQLLYDEEEEEKEEEETMQRFRPQRLAAAVRHKATKSGTWLEGELNLDTNMVHAAVTPEPKSGAILTPLFLSTTFIQESVEKYLDKGYSYSRTNNPTVTALEEKLAKVENGFGSSAFGTGMAATTSAISATMQAGDHCVISDCSYGGTNRSCREFFTPLNMEFDFVDFRDPENVKKAMKPNTKLVFSETPANPVLSLTDIEAVSKIAHEAGAKHVVDATFATPVICRPLDWGADMVIQSLTKYYEGHNMMTGGQSSFAVIEAAKEAAATRPFKLDANADIVAGFQRSYFAAKLSKRGWWAPFEEISEESRDISDGKRRRAVWLYFTNVACALKRMFFGAGNDHDGGSEGGPETAARAGGVQKRCVLSVNVADDTNIKLADGQNHSTVVRTVLSNVQSHLVFSDEVASELPQWFYIHQPLVSLKRATAEQLYHQFLSWTLSFAGKAGQRWQSWGVPADIFQHARRHVFIFVTDALKSNDAVFHELAKTVHQQSATRTEQHSKSDQHLAMQHHCLIHQVSLTRKALALGFCGYWTTLVRFGHCFESFGFRQRFHAAMSKVISDSFDFVEVAALPNAKTRLAAATCVEPRRLSGWNVYLREGMQQFSSTELSKEEYSAQSSALATKWRRLDQEEQEKYTIKANYEQTCRDELQTRPLAAGHGWQEGSEGSDVPVGEVQSADSLSTSQLEKIAGRTCPIIGQTFSRSFLALERWFWIGAGCDGRST
eukprot:s3612_g4.t4